MGKVKEGKAHPCLLFVANLGCRRAVGPARGLPDMMSALEGGGGHGKAHVLREVV